MSDEAVSTTQVINDDGVAAEEETEVDSKPVIDMVLERVGQYLGAGRKVPPVFVYCKEDDPVMVITGRTSEDDNEEDRHAAIMEALYLLPATNARYTYVALVDYVLIDGAGLQQSAIITRISNNEAKSFVYPYKIDGREVVFTPDAQIDPTAGSVVAQTIAHMFRTFVDVHTTPDLPSNLIDWLVDIGHEIEFQGDWTAVNIDALSGW